MVEVSRIQRALERWGDRFLKRVFTQVEIEYCQHKVREASRFALRFAAKEAFSKALGLGFSNGLTFRQIEVVRNQDGPPQLTLYRRAQELCQRHGVKSSFLSLADEGKYAIAVVVLEA